MNLLDAMQAHNVAQASFFRPLARRTANPVKIPISEDHVAAAGESLRRIEAHGGVLLHWYGVSFGLRSVALRYFNAAGADPDGEMGEDHDPETHLIPLAISAAMGLVPALQIFGTDYDTPDGTAIRDYLHVTDLAEAHVAALRYLDGGGASTAINLGTGSGYSVREVTAMVEQVSGRKVPVREVGRRAGDPPCLGRRRIEIGQRRWGGGRSHSALEEIVRTAWNWKAKQRLPRCDRWLLTAASGIRRFLFPRSRLRGSPSIRVR